MTDTFGPYRLDGPLGQGGMGEVHRAYDTRREREVALKQLRAELAGDVDFQRRFRRECSLAARLSSPHVVPIHDFGEIDGQLFLDMRLIDGQDLRAVLSEAGSLPADRAVEIIRQIADALDCAHAADLVHRDVKPSNILITTHRGRDFAYLTDFGVVRAQGSSDSSITRTGTTIGTLAYMAPEVFTGTDIDQRVDIYALGCLLFEILTGRPPFTGDAPTLMYQHLNTQPPSLPEELPAHARRLDEVIRRALAKAPEERFTSAGDLADAATAALDGRTSAPATTMVGRTGIPTPTLIAPSSPRTVRDTPEPTAVATPPRHRAIGLAVTGIAAAAALIVGVWIWHSGGTDPQAPTTAAQPGASTSYPATTFNNRTPATATAPTAEQVIKALAVKIPAARFTVTFDEQTDPNHLLGRPNGYLSKASLTDSRIPRNAYLDNDRGAVDSGGSVEVFADAESANARKTYIQAITKGFPAAAEYDYISGPILLRVSKSLTPTQASEYERALQGLGK